MRTLDTLETIAIAGGNSSDINLPYIVGGFVTGVLTLKVFQYISATAALVAAGIGGAYIAHNYGPEIDEALESGKNFFNSLTKKEHIVIVS